MGKSEAAGMFRRLRVPVFDSDAEVHRLLGQNGPAVGPVSAAFPVVMRAGASDRQALGADVVNNADYDHDVENEVVGAGTHTIVFPAKNPGARKVTGSAKGKFHGVIIP